MTVLLASLLLGSAGLSFAVADRQAGHLSALPAFSAQGRQDAVELMGPCVRSSDRVGCLRVRLRAAVLTVGPESAFAAYDLLRAQDPTLAFDCHDPGHRVGSEAFELLGDVRVALAYVGRSCQSAYAHGVLDAWGRGDALDGEQWALVFDACEGAEPASARFLCFDGVGHVVSMRSQSWGQAVAMCGWSRLLEAREGCVSGLVMQAWAPLLQEYVDRDASLDDIAGTCASLPPWPVPVVPAAGWDSGDGSPSSACRRAAVYPFATEMMVSGGSLQRRLGHYVERCRSLGPGRPDGRGPVAQDVSWCVGQSGWALLYVRGMDGLAAREDCALLGLEFEDACVAAVADGVREDGAGTWDS